MEFYRDWKDYGFDIAWYNLRFKAAFFVVRPRTGRSKMTVLREIDGDKVD